MGPEGPRGPQGESGNESFLGSYQDSLPFTDRQGRPLSSGQYAYLQSTKTTYVWQGDRWSAAAGRFSVGVRSVLEFHIAAGQSVVAGLDLSGGRLDFRNELVIYQDGILLPPSGYLLDAQEDRIVLANPPAGSAIITVVQHIGPDDLRPGAATLDALSSIEQQFDGATRRFSATLATDGSPIPDVSTSQLILVMDGVLQRPGGDFVVVGEGSIEFAVAPPIQTRFWGALIRGRPDDLSTGAVALQVQQAGHGFLRGEAVYYAGGQWQRALSRSDSSLGVGVVGSTSINTFNVVFTGIVDGLAGLDQGWQYVSDVQAGTYSTVPPNEDYAFVNPIGFALDSTRLVVVPMRASQILPNSGGIGGGGDVQATVLKTDLADDTSTWINLGNDFRDLVTIVGTGDPAPAAAIVLDTSTPYLGLSLASPEFSVVGSVGPLAGNTGPDGSLNLGVDSTGGFWVENRTGVVRTLTMRFGTANAQAGSSGVGGGTGGSNVGTGVGVFYGPLGDVLRFRSLRSLTSSLTIQPDGVEVVMAIALASHTVAGLMSAADKTALDNLSSLVAGVASFNGRTGIVSPAHADYHASQIICDAVGSTAATTVQAAIAELTTETSKVGHVHPMTELSGFDMSGVLDGYLPRWNATAGKFQGAAYPSGGGGGSGDEIDGGDPTSAYDPLDEIDGGDPGSVFS